MHSRFIPAYAGNSNDCIRFQRARPVHPRLRGELLSFSKLCIRFAGSSPLTRGTQRKPRFHNSCVRFIPAYAGNSPLEFLRFIRIAGSSPLTRGTPGLKHCPFCPVRFIPAYAGNSAVQNEPQFFADGSSPLTRGTRRYFCWHSKWRRFIPAYAGNSVETHSEASCWSVHPRLRGELMRDFSSFTFICGSSPLTRGTLEMSALVFVNCRFIPAYAGNSVRKFECAGRIAVHPRLRGELSVLLERLAAITGSSPLTRGTRTLQASIRRYDRFIPAYAGNSLKDGINPSIHTLGI